MKNCLACQFHKVIPDPDPYDSFCDDDQAIVCTKMKNDKQNMESPYLADHSEFKKVVVSCRPYNLKHEDETPEWCPLIK